MKITLSQSLFLILIAAFTMASGAEETPSPTEAPEEVGPALSLEQLPTLLEDLLHPDHLRSSQWALEDLASRLGSPNISDEQRLDFVQQLLHGTDIPSFDVQISPPPSETHPNGLLQLLDACAACAAQAQAGREIRLEAWKTRLYYASLVAPRTAAAGFAPALRHSETAALFEAALAALQRIPGQKTTQTMINLHPELQEKRRTLVLGALAERRDTLAIPLFNQQSFGKNIKDKHIAIKALAALGIPPEDKNRHNTRYATAGLAAAQTCAARGKSKEAEKIFLDFVEYFNTNHQLRAALSGLAQLNSNRFIPLALGYLNTDKVRRTAIALLAGFPDPKTDKALLKAYKKADGNTQAMILEVLSRRRAPGLSELLSKALLAPDAAVRFTAARLSGVQPNVEDAFELAMQGNSWFSAPALRIYLDIAHQRAIMGEAEAAADQFRTLLDLELDLETSREALDALGRVGEERDLHPLSYHAKHPDYGEQAATAIAAILSRLPASTARQEELIAIAKSSPYDRAASAALEGLQGSSFPLARIARQRGYLTAWRLLGPFPAPHFTALNTAFFEEGKGDAAESVSYAEEAFSWIDVEAKEMPALLALDEILGVSQESLAYLFTRIILPEWTPATLHLFPAQDCAIRLNGELVHHPREAGAYEGSGLEIPVVLKGGINRLLIKSLSTITPWRIGVRLSDREGVALNLSRQELPDDGARGVGTGVGAARSIAHDDMP